MLFLSLRLLVNYNHNISETIMNPSTMGTNTDGSAGTISVKDAISSLFDKTSTLPKDTGSIYS